MHFLIVSLLLGWWSLGKFPRFPQEGSWPQPSIPQKAEVCGSALSCAMSWWMCPWEGCAWRGHRKVASRAKCLFQGKKKSPACVKGLALELSEVSECFIYTFFNVNFHKGFIILLMYHVRHLHAGTEQVTIIRICISLPRIYVWGLELPSSSSWHDM